MRAVAHVYPMCNRARHLVSGAWCPRLLNNNKTTTTTTWRLEKVYTSGGRGSVEYKYSTVENVHVHRAHDRSCWTSISAQLAGKYLTLVLSGRNKKVPHSPAMRLETLRRQLQCAIIELSELHVLSTYTMESHRFVCSQDDDAAAGCQ